MAAVDSPKVAAINVTVAGSAWSVAEWSGQDWATCLTIIVLVGQLILMIPKLSRTVFNFLIWLRSK